MLGRWQSTFRRLRGCRRGGTELRGGRVDEFRTGLNISRVDEITDEEKNAHLVGAWQARGPLYQLWCNELLVDYAPTFDKLQVRGTRYVTNGRDGQPSYPDLLLWSVHNLPSYMMYGWETGIHNEFWALWRFGMPIEQTMELVMFAQLYAGMRGLGHVYRAVGDFLPAWGAPPIAMEWPEGWTPDPEAFKSGLDLSTREMTVEDRDNLESWYETNIGYVPNSIRFGLKYHPEFVKVNRAKWEVAIRTLPKQVAPYIMLKMNAISQNEEGLREAMLLSKSWGIEKRYIIELLNGVIYYFTGPEGWYAPAAAIEDVLDAME
jgi:hypothetical protein